MKVRSSYKPYVEYVDEFFEKFAEQIVDLQFTKGDGPIIAFQVCVLIPLLKFIR